MGLGSVSVSGLVDGKAALLSVVGLVDGKAALPVLVLGFGLGLEL